MFTLAYSDAGPGLLLRSGGWVLVSSSSHTTANYVVGIVIEKRNARFSGERLRPMLSYVWNPGGCRGLHEL